MQTKILPAARSTLLTEPSRRKAQATLTKFQSYFYDQVQFGSDNVGTRQQALVEVVPVEKVEEDSIKHSNPRWHHNNKLKWPAEPLHHAPQPRMNERSEGKRAHCH
jgi:hypothetical protein